MELKTTDAVKLLLRRFGFFFFPPWCPDCSGQHKPQRSRAPHSPEIKEAGRKSRARVPYLFSAFIQLSNYAIPDLRLFLARFIHLMGDFWNNTVLL